MTSLDLTEAPPRPPQEELRGLCMLPRMIDIARAMLPGGRVGDYQIGRGVSGAVLAAFGIPVAQFIELVRAAATDGDVADMLWSHRKVPAARLNRRLCSLTVADVPEDLRPEFQRFYGTDHPSDRRVFDILQADDTRSFAQRA